MDVSIVADVLVVAAGTLIVTLRDRRTLTMALGVVPLVIAIVQLELGGHAVAPRSLLATMLGGESAVAILVVAAVTHPVERRLNDASSHGPIALRFDDASPFAVLSALLAGVVAYQFAREHSIGGVPAAFASYWLVGTGLFTILQSADLFKLAVGILLLVNGLLLGAIILGIADLPTLVAVGIFQIIASFAVAHLVEANEAARDDTP